jgi:hypothetical protein
MTQLRRMNKLKVLINHWLREAVSLNELLMTEYAHDFDDIALNEHYIGNVGYLSYRLVTRLGNCLDGIRALQWIVSDSSNHSLLERISKLSITLNEKNRIKLTQLYLKHRFSELQSEHFTDVENLFFSICEFKDLITASHLCASWGDKDLHYQQIDSLTNSYAVLIQDLPKVDRTVLRDSVRNLLSSEFLYERAYRKEESNPYEFFFHTALLTNQSQQMNEKIFPNSNDPLNIKGILQGTGVSSDLAQAIKRILEELNSMVKQDGVNVFDVFGHGRDIVTGYHDADVMVIPGDGSGSCKPILIGIAATKVRRSNGSPKEVMGRMQEILVSCSPTVEVAIFISDAAGMGRVLEENLGLIRAHIRKGHGLKVFIPVMIVGNSMTIINWDS